MNDLAGQFEEARPHLNAVAYRMLGSASEAEDAVQEAWFRLARSDADAIENLRGWLTTVVGRVCLDVLRARREVPTDSLPEPIIVETEGDPEHEALMAESVGLAILVVLETLSPGERLAFVLHDMFAVPFSEIAEILGRSPDSARQLASRARRRVRGAKPAADADLARQREIVNAFLAASRAGDFERLVAMLDPEVEFRVDIGPARERFASGAEVVAQRVLARGSRFAPFGRFALVNGAPGVLVAQPGRHPQAVVSFTVVEGRIAGIDVVADPTKLRGVSVSPSD